MTPVKVMRINKITKDVVESYRFRWSAIGFPGVNLGGGAGGGASFRAGVGFIWGDLVNPGNFAGPVGGITGNFQAGVGHNLSIGILKQSKANRSNIFALAQWQAGGAVEASVQAFAGVALTLDEYLQKLGLGAPSLPTDEPKKDEMQWKTPDDSKKSLQQLACYL